MIDAEETKRNKAKQLRYKKPIVKELNLDRIMQELWDIQEECEDVHWYTDTDEETLLNALDGNEDEAYEFKMMFADLCAECEMMMSDLNMEWVPECFDRFFVAAGAGESCDGLLGYDSYEQDYFRLSCTDAWAEDESKKALKRMTKDELIEAARQCFRIYQSFIALRYRYDCLKAAMDILRDQNTGYLQMIKQIEEVYEKADKESEGFRYLWAKEVQELEQILKKFTAGGVDTVKGQLSLFSEERKSVGKPKKEKNMDSSQSFDERMKRFWHYMETKGMNEQWIETSAGELRIVVEALADYYDMAYKHMETMEIGYAKSVWEDRLERIKQIQAKLEESIGYNRDKQFEICAKRKSSKKDDIGEDALVLASRKGKPAVNEKR